MKWLKRLFGIQKKAVAPPIWDHKTIVREALSCAMKGTNISSGQFEELYKLVWASEMVGRPEAATLINNFCERHNIRRIAK